MRNRHKNEVIRDVLHSAMGGAGISKIMFQAYLSHAQATSYLSDLIQDGMILNDTMFGKRYYKITSKGIEYLDALETMSELLPIDTRRRANRNVAFNF